MHHMYTGNKGDPLCPLGFHPQVRWPTRCKRCFRDYKEHGKGKDSESSLAKDDMTRSTPSLSSWSSSISKSRNSVVSSQVVNSETDSRDYAFTNNSRPNTVNSSFSSNKTMSSSSSWTSTPDLGNMDDSVSTTVSVTLPRRRRTSDLSNNIDAANKPSEFTIRRRSYTSEMSQSNLQNGSSTAEKPKTKSSDNSGAVEKLKTDTSTNTKVSIKKSAGETKKSSSGKPPGKLKKIDVSEVNHEDHINPDVEFIFRVKSSKQESGKNSNISIRQTSPILISARTSTVNSSGPENVNEEEEDDDSTSVAETETTETTLVGKSDNELLEEVESLRNELEQMRARCERVEREKSDILLRRLASFDTTSTKTAASEVLKLQQKVNELSMQSEDLKDNNKVLTLKIKELEKDLEEQKRTSEAARRADELQAKLAAAETLCEELMDENEDMKKELRELEEEIEEMQDNFREDQADEYSSLKKELEQTTKNCRILSFKLRKSERRAEQLETEKLETELKYKEFLEKKGVTSVEKMKKLEEDLKVSNDLATRLTKELEEANKRLKIPDSTKNQPNSLNSLPKLVTGEKVSRASLTRGGSQEDPQQLLRDLQDSLEREADLREQLRFAEEEAASLRKKAARVEEDNDSLALQLKKMATKAKSARRSSPCATTRTPKPVVEKDEGISDEEDPAELRLMLELNEQESAVLRKKVEELETESELNKKKIKELEEKLTSSRSEKKFGGVISSFGSNSSLSDKEKIKVAEQEISELRKKVIEKERDIERLESEVHLSQKKPKGQLIKSQSLDSPTEQKTLDLKRQLQLVESEAAILRTKITTLETDNEKLSAENKKLQLLRGTKKSAVSSDCGTEDKKADLESKLATSTKEIKELKEKLEKYESEKKSSVSVIGKTTETEKIKKELKTKTDEVDKLTKENKNIQDILKRIRDEAALDAVNFYKNRKPKKPTDLTTKLQMKKMVEDLENEIGDILVVLQRVSGEKSSSINFTSTSKEEIEEKNNKIRELEEKLNKEKKKYEEDNKVKLETLENGNKKLEEEKKKLEANLNKLQKEKTTWKTEKKDLETQIENLVSEKKNSMIAQDEVSIFSKKLENANKQLEEEKQTVVKLNKQIENMTKLEQDKLQLQKDLSEKIKEIAELEKKVSEGEEKIKKTERNLSLNKAKVTKLEKTVEELEESKASKEKLRKGLEDELSEVKSANASLKSKVEEVEKEIKKGKDTIKNLEESIRKERERATDECFKVESVEKKEITALREDLSKKSKQLEEINEKCEKLEKAKKLAEEKCKKAEVELTKEKKVWSEKTSELENNLNAECKKAEKLKVANDKELKNHEVELSSLKSKLKTLEQSNESLTKKMSDVKDERSAKIQRLEKELETEKRKYEDLTTKYELLEEEHVVTKAQLVMEKEHVQNQVGVNKKEIAALEKNLENVQEAWARKEDAWVKEKKELMEKIKAAAENAAKASEVKWELEKSKLQAINEEQSSLSEQLKQQNESMMEQMDHMRKENEDLRKKLDDFDKVAKIQRQMSADTTQLEMQLREARGKLAAEEKNHKSEMAALKLRYESRVNLINDELQSSQNQVSRFKRERDTYKHMLEEAQTQMADLKKGGHRRNSLSDGELKDSKTVIANLEQQVSCMEDELSEARLECSKLKTELVSEKSAWEVKLSELQSKVNELEEEKILSSGRTKVVGLRTKMELAWQKEREDQQKLLQETSTLARDLRQTLYEVERERDKERLEFKRRQEQVKRASEEEMEENRKKITELQCDLLELRDAHAKLRTTNEKLRKEKDKWDKENRQIQRSRIRSEEEERKFSILLENIDLLLEASFEKKNSGKFFDSKKRSGSKSRESSPLTTSLDENSARIQVILQRLNETAEDIRAKRQEEERDEGRNKRASSVGFKRAASTESDSITTSSVVRRPAQPHRKNSLHRKSLSLSETTGFGAQDQVIWREENSGSLTSLEEQISSRYRNVGHVDSSMDSRLSGGSTQSEVILGDKKKKKGLFGKLKKLTKSRSIEDSTSSQEDILRGGGGSDSDMSIGPETNIKGSKRDLKGKIADMFKKESSSKSGSTEQLKKPDDRKAKTLSRDTPSSVYANVSTLPKNSTLGRPLDKSKNPAASLLKKP